MPHAFRTMCASFPLFLSSRWRELYSTSAAAVFVGFSFLLLLSIGTDGRTGAREEPDLRDACTKLVVSSVGVKGREGGRRAEEEQAIEKRRGSSACPCLPVLGREGERRAPSLRPSELGSESSSSRQSFASLGRSSTCVRSVPLFSCAPLTFTYSFVLLPTAIIAIIIQIL